MSGNIRVILVMLLSPYCAAAPEGLNPETNVNGWDCFRGVTLGLFNVFAFLFCSYASVRIGRVCYRTRGWFALNLLMLLLASLQCLLTAVKYTVVKEQRLAFAAAYFRGLQSLLTCLFYGRAAADALNKSAHYFRCLLPLLAVLALYLTILFIVALTLESIPCYHPNWLLMSGSQMFITVMFAISGVFVMRDLYYAPANVVRREYIDGVDGEQFEVKLRRKAVKVLLVFNALGATVQLVLDVWLQQKYSNGLDCRVLDTPTEEIARLIMKLFSYDVPVVVTIYVFYLLPRRQFDTGMDLIMDDHAHLDTIEQELLQNW